MERDKKLGIGLATLSLLAAAGAAVYYGALVGRVPMVVLIWPALGLLAGVLLFTSNIVQSTLSIEDELAQFPRLIADDLDHLQHRTITPTLLYIAATAVAIFVEVALLLWFHKAEAAWGPVNVLAVAAVVFAVALAYTVRSPLFQSRRERLRPIFFIAPAAGWLLCAGIGVAFTEPREYGGVSPLMRANTNVTVTAAVSSRRSGTYFALDTIGDAAFNMDCDDEGCLIMLLIGVVIACVLASAYIPHFWVVASILLLTLMVVFALRELLYYEAHANSAGS